MKKIKYKILQFFFILFHCFLLKAHTVKHPTFVYETSGLFFFSDEVSPQKLCDIPKETDLFKSIFQHCLDVGFKKNTFNSNDIFIFWGMLPEILNHDRELFLPFRIFDSDNYTLVSFTGYKLSLFVPRKI